MHHSVPFLPRQAKTRLTQALLRAQATSALDAGSEALAQEAL